MDIPQIDPHLLTDLLRFIYLGTERPIYFPGCWTSKNRFGRMKAVDAIFQNNSNNTEVVNIIIEIYREGWYTRYETIAFVLCKCILLGGPEVKAACYKAILEICQTSEELMLFTKYCRIFKSGNGQGWCKSINNWYNSKTSMELAKEFTRAKARHGIKHSILLKKSHIKISPEDVSRDAVVKYALFGLKHAKKLLGEKEGIEEVFNYIEVVDTLKHCEDPLVASEMASYYKFTLDHMPAHLLTFPEVWNAILPQMSLNDVLHNLFRIHNLGFLTPGSSTSNVITFLLNDKDLIKKSDLTPLAVYITLCNYSRKELPMKYEKMKSALVKIARRRLKQEFDLGTGVWKWNVKKSNPKEVKHWGIDQPPNGEVIIALNKLLNETWLLTPSVGVRYLITVDMREHMFKGKHFCKVVAPQLQEPSTSSAGNENIDNPMKSNKKHIFAQCFYNNGVTPGHAAIVLVSHILKREKDVRIAIFTDPGIQIIKLNRNFKDIQEIEQILRAANKGRVQMDAPIQWAMKTKAKIDVFINMVDRTTRLIELNREARVGRGPGGRYGPPPPLENIQDHCPARVLEKYRQQCNQPKSKLIVMSLASHRVRTTDGNHSGILDIVGIDKHVLKVMDAFVKDKFY